MTIERIIPLREQDIEEELLPELSLCDLITEDDLSGDLPRCYGFPHECKDCNVKDYLDSFGNYLKSRRLWGGKIMFDLKSNRWVGRKNYVPCSKSKNLIED